MKNFFKNLWTGATSQQSKIYREWDRQRSIARTPSELAEIDAIFARNV
jgi:hypothetical protein